MADISGYLQNIRNGARGEDVRDSIINALDKINKDNPSVIKPLNVTANGTYAGEGGIVYNPITVNVPEGASQALTLTDISITENGEYSPDEGAAYRTITVEVPQYLNEIMQEEKVLYLEEGEQTVHALADGYDGYAVVHVMSGGTGGGGGATYYVDFMASDHTTLLERVTNVPFGGGAVYHKTPPTASGMRFVGWSPNPLNVRANTVCFPRFENIIYDDTQILDDWVTIAKNVRNDPDAYPIGSWKLLEFGAFTFNSINYTAGLNVKMQLIAKGVDKLEGENGYASTTWMSKTHFKMSQPNGSQRIEFSPNNFDLFMTDFYNALNGNFMTQAFPQDLLTYIRKVIKTTARYGVKEGLPDSLYTDYPSVEGLFTPSAYEMLGLCTDYADYFLPGGQYANSALGETGGLCYDIFCKDPSTGTPLSIADSASLRVIDNNQTTLRGDAFRRGAGQAGRAKIESDGTVQTNSYYRLTTAGVTRLGFCL